jgi:peptide/nickel transport system permease protein
LTVTQAQMAGQTDALAVLPADAAVGRGGIRGFLSIPEGAIGAGLALILIVVIVIGPYVAPYDPEAIGAIPGLGPSSAHWLGTDPLGRDVFSRVLAGGRLVLLLPVIAIAIAITAGAAVGLLTGYLGGVVDLVVTRVIDVVLALPSFLLVLVIIAAFGAGDANVVVAVAIVYTPGIARVIRGATQAIRPREFVLAARARGDSIRWIVFREIAPNISATLLVETAMRLTLSILFIASLNFLGLGVQPPAPDWGNMINENRIGLTIQPWGVLLPLLALAVLAIGSNVIADGVARTIAVIDRQDAR